VTRYATSSDSPPSRAAAWSCLAANLFLWPGLGSIAARRKVGLVQMGLSAAGVVMVCVCFVWFFYHWVKAGRPPAWSGPYVRIGVMGAVIFMLSWFWALATSISIVRSTKHGPPPLPQSQ